YGRNMGDPEPTFVQARRGADGLLRAVAFAAERFLGAPDWREALAEVLPALGTAAGVRRIGFVETPPGPDAEIEHGAWSERTRAPLKDVPSGTPADLSIPVAVNGDPWGSLRIVAGAHSPSDEELDALTAAAAVLGAAIGRSRADRQLRDEGTRYRTLVEQIPAITYVDVEPEVGGGPWPTVYISPQIEAILGYP